jgi:hypothetical protein
LAGLVGLNHGKNHGKDHPLLLDVDNSGAQLTPKHPKTSKDAVNGILKSTQASRLVEMELTSSHRKKWS